MGKFRHMTWTDRLIIEKYYNRGHTYRFIAELTGFSVGAIYREVQRGLCDCLDGSTWISHKKYSASIADDDAIEKATAKGKPIKLGKNHTYAKLISDKIKAGFAPDVIVGVLRLNNKWTVSTTTLYRYIDMGFIPDISNSNLLVKSRRKRTYKKIKKASRPPKGKSIEQRPEHIETREDIGHWEMDSVIGKAKGKGESLLVLTERSTRYELIAHLPDKSAGAVVRALNRIILNFPPNTFLSITVDNGSEFQDCYGIEHDKKGNKRMDVYYCHPYSSWERGSNENANKLIRRFLPKGQSLKRVTQRNCRVISDWINNYPRKLLNYRTSAQLFNEWQATK